MEEAHRFALPALALTDRDGVYGAVRAHVKARELGTKLIIGSEITIEDGSTILLLVQDRGGYANLCRLITKGRLRSEKGESVVTWEEVCAHARGLIALGRGENASVMPAKTGIQARRNEANKQNLDSRPSTALRTGLHGNDGERNENGLSKYAMSLDQVVGNLRDAFADRLYVMIARHRREEEIVQEKRLRELSARFGVPLIAANEILYHTPARRSLQDTLTAIRHGIPIAACGRKLKPNAEYGLKPPYAFAALFGDDPLVVARTLEVAERCNFSLSEIRYRYPTEQLPSGMTSMEWLRQQTFHGPTLSRRRWKKSSRSSKRSNMPATS